MKLIGASVNAAVTGAAELSGKSNYFIGTDTRQWHTNVPNFAEVKYSGVYPGIDLIYYGNQSGQLEYDFVLAPGSDPRTIQLDVAATGDVSGKITPRLRPLALAPNGDLIVKAGVGEIRFHKPLVYQNKSPGHRCAVGSNQCTEVRASFALTASNQVSFAVGPYDHAKPLVIDPVLSYSTYLGGNGTDIGYGIAVDSSGAAYVTGAAGSTNFPTVNPLQPTHAGGGHAFIAKFNAAGTALVYSSYLGGSLADSGTAVAVDSAGNAYLTGFTTSDDFPTVNPVQPTNSFDNRAAFVAKVNPAGSALIYSTYLGGDNGTNNGSGTGGLGIAVDSVGNVYVTGFTVDTNFPTVNPLQATNLEAGLAPTGFVAKYNPAGSALIYSTYLGGSGGGGGVGDQAQAIAADSSGNTYVTGQTYSTNFPTANALQSTCVKCPGASDAFVVKIDATGTAFVYSTYLGGNGQDTGLGITADSAGNAYVAGSTTSTNFPTVNPVQANNHGTENVFVSKLNPVGSALVYSTYLGGSSGDGAFGIALDSSGDAYVTGRTASTDFPIVNAVQPTKAGGPGPDAVFVSAFNADGSALLYSTYLGGTSGERGYAIAVDSSDSAYVTGYTFSSDFPTTPGAFQTTLSSGGENVFAAKLPRATAAPPSPPTVTVKLASTTITVGQSTMLSWSTTNAMSCTASGAWNGTKAVSGLQSESPTAIGSSTYTLTCSGAGGSASASAVLSVNAAVAAPTVTLSANPASIEIGQNATLTWSTTNASACTASGAWNGTKAVSGSQSESPTATGSSTYTLTCSGAGGSASASAVLSVNAAVAAPTVTLLVSPASIEVGQNATLTWSSTNASTCTASRAWTGARATSGTVTVTPSSAGSLTYQLTCAGSASTSPASSTTLTVNARPVTATALSGKAGGGSMDLWSLLGFGILLAVRIRGLKSMGLGALAALAAVSFLFAAWPVSAQDGPQVLDFNWNQAYVGIRAGSTHYWESSRRLDADLAADGEAGTVTSIGQNRGGGVAYIGVPFYRALSLELGFADLGVYHVGISTTSSNIPQLAQTIVRNLSPAGRGLTLNLAAPLDINAWFAIEPRLGALGYQSKQEVYTPLGTFSHDREGAGIDAGLSLLLRPTQRFNAGVGVDCFGTEGRCGVMLYSAEIEYHFGR